MLGSPINTAHDTVKYGVNVHSQQLYHEPGVM